MRNTKVIFITPIYLVKKCSSLDLVIERNIGSCHHKIKAQLPSRTASVCITQSQGGQIYDEHL